MTVGRTAEVERARSDAAIAAFVAEHYDRLLRLARLVCRDTSDAADAVQVGLEQAWRKRSTLRDDARVRAWLDRIVVREAVRISKSRQSWLSRLPPSTLGQLLRQAVEEG
jgi:DNA-directed RNA polymerase specialized sigma24 family protein